MWLLIVLLARLGRRGSGGFVHDTVTRFMGLIVIAMGTQFALSGMRSFMRETGHAAVGDRANAAVVTQTSGVLRMAVNNSSGEDSEQKE